MNYSLCPYCHTWFETNMCALHISRCPSFPASDKNIGSQSITIDALKKRTQHIGGVYQTDDKSLTEKTE